MQRAQYLEVQNKKHWNRNLKYEKVTLNCLQVQEKPIINFWLSSLASSSPRDKGCLRWWKYSEGLSQPVRSGSRFLGDFGCFSAFEQHTNKESCEKKTLFCHQSKGRFVYSFDLISIVVTRGVCKPWSDQISTRSQQLHRRTSVSFIRPSCRCKTWKKKKSLREQKDQFIRNQSETSINFAYLTSDSCDLRGQLHLNSINSITRTKWKRFMAEMGIQQKDVLFWFLETIFTSCWIFMRSVGNFTSLMLFDVDLCTFYRKNKRNLVHWVYLIQIRGLEEQVGKSRLNIS